MYYLCSENKGADQLRGYREADLRLCFRICKKPVIISLLMGFTVPPRKLRTYVLVNRLEVISLSNMSGMSAPSYKPYLFIGVVLYAGLDVSFHLNVG